LAADSNSSPSGASFTNAQGPSPEEGATSVELRSKVCPQLEEALGFHDKLDSDSLPEKTWLRASKPSYQQPIDQILGAGIRAREAFAYILVFTLAVVTWGSS
jgi:hypothetical protein